LPAEPEHGGAGPTIPLTFREGGVMDPLHDAVPGDNEERFRAQYEAIACAVVAQDATGAILYANPAAEDLLGLSLSALRASVVNQVAEVADEEGRVLPPEERPAMRALREGVPQRRVMIRRRRPGAEERWLQIDAVPLAGADGRPEAVVSTLV